MTTMKYSPHQYCCSYVLLQLLQWKANTKLDESKSRDFHPDLRFLNEQFKRIEREREDLSYELGDCLKERNELASKSALLVKLSKYE